MIGCAGGDLEAEITEAARLHDVLDGFIGEDHSDTRLILPALAVGRVVYLEHDGGTGGELLGVARREDGRRVAGDHGAQEPVVQADVAAINLVLALVEQEHQNMVDDVLRARPGF